MLNIRVENFNDLVMVECKGRIFHSDAVFALRDAVQAQTRGRVIALDLSEVEAIGGGGLGMLVFLDHWAREHDIHLKLFSPSEPVLEGLARSRALSGFEIAGFHEMMELLAHCENFGRSDNSQYTMAA
jgi:anti-anti-sigma regulatory factor